MNEDRPAPVRVLYVSEIPTPYRRPFLKQLAEDPDISLRVLYCAASQADREWKMEEAMHDFEEVLPGVHWCSNRKAGYFNRFNPALFRFLTRKHADVVIFGAYYVMSMWTGMYWCRLLGIPYILLCESHGMRERKGWRVAAREILIGPLIRSASAWLPLGNLARDYLVRQGARREACHCCPNTPDVDRLVLACRALPAIPVLRELFGLPRENPVFLYIGRFVAIKRIDLLLAAFHQLKEKHPEAVLALAGSGPEEGRLHQQITEAGIRDVFFLGFQPETKLPSLYSMADAMVLPSDDEPWAVVVNEAMACGCKVIASDRVGAAHDLIVPPSTGRIFPAGNAPALAAAMADLLAEGPSPRRPSEACQAQAHDWGYPRCLQAVKAALHSALQQR